MDLPCVYITTFGNRYYRFFSVPCFLYSTFFLADLSEDENGSVDPNVPYGLALPTLLKDKLSMIKDHAKILFVSPQIVDKDSFGYSEKNDRDLTLVISDSFKGSWLDTPKRGDEEFSDWCDVKNKLPCNKLKGSLVPPNCNIPPHALPLSFTDPKVRKFFEEKHLALNNEIRVSSGTNNPFGFQIGNSVSATSRQRSVSLIDRFLRNSLSEVLAINTLLRYVFGHIGGQQPQRRGSDSVIDFPSPLLENILYIAISSLLRTKEVLACAIVRNRELLRELVLEKVSSPKEVANSLKYSDFGSPLLFGPVRDEIAKLINIKDFGKSCEDFKIKPKGYKRGRSGRFGPLKGVRGSRSSSQPGSSSQKPSTSNRDFFPRGSRRGRKKLRKQSIPTTGNEGKKSNS